MQKTQQWLGLGLRRAPQPRQSQKHRQASVGITSRLCLPQCGQVSTASTTIGVSASPTQRFAFTRSTISSPKVFGRLGTPVGQPLNQRPSLASTRGVHRRETIVSDPIEGCASREKKLRRFALTTVASAPEGVGNFVWWWNVWSRGTGQPRSQRGWTVVREMLLHTIHQAQRIRLPECRTCSPLDQPPRCFPLPERYRISQRCAAANHGARRFDVSASIEKSIQHRNVIAACGPMERRLRMRTGEPRVDFRASRDQRDHGSCAVWKMSGPVSCHMQQRSRHPLAVIRVGILLLLVARPVIVCAADVTAKVIDRLGRPVANAVIDIHWLKSVSKDDVRKIDLVKLVSDRDGIVKGTYDEASVPKDEDIWVEVSKTGYSGYSTTGLRPEFVLDREFGAADVRRIAGLEGETQINQFRELLAGDFENSGSGLDELVFVQEHRFRSGLRALVSNPKVGTAAGQILAFIGVPDDLLLFLDHVPAPKRELFEDRWAYGVVCALLEPATEREWTFLRNCAVNDYDDLWVDAGAIRTLKLIASPKSKQVLEEVGRKNKDRAASIEAAIKYIESVPAPLSDEDIVVAGRKVAQVIKIGKWQGNKPPQYNEKKDKALVACEFIAGRDLLVHTATFHKVDGNWRLRGVRETMQALLAREPETDAKPDKSK